MRGSFTFKNYNQWLTPFTDWLERQAKQRPVVVTSRTIRSYMKSQEN